MPFRAGPRHWTLQPEEGEKLTRTLGQARGFSAAAGDDGSGGTARGGTWPWPWPWPCSLLSYGRSRSLLILHKRRRSFSE